MHYFLGLQFIKIMNMTRKASRVMLLLAVGISASTLSSCANATKHVVGGLISYGGGLVLDCVVKDECPTANTESKTVKATLGPDKAVEEYYQLINQRQYANAWAFLTPRFQRLKPDNNYNNYEQWWESVDSVKIDSIRLIEKSKSEAVVDAKLKYLMKNGRQWDDPSRITLIFNSNGKWLIDDKTKSEI
jgi:hypothetical protein